MEALQTSRGKTCVVAAGAATLAVAYGAFHNWIWKCHYLSFPAYRASHPTPWRSLRSHKLTLVRLWRFATAPFRRLPDFYIIGAPKTGSSALHDYLVKHPDVLPPFVKETRFMFGFCGLKLSSLAYRSMFPLRLTSLFGNTVAFDADVAMSHSPEMAAAMIARFTPKAKIIFCHREPVQRAWSMYKFLARVKGSPFHGKSFKEVCDREFTLMDSQVWSEAQRHADAFDSGRSVRISDACATAALRCPILKPGRYADILTAFQKRQGAENIMVINFKDFAASTESVVKKIFSFLGLKDLEIEKLDKIMPEEVMENLVMDGNADKSAPSPQEKELLTKYFAEQSRDFAGLLGQDLSSLW